MVADGRDVVSCLLNDTRGRVLFLCLERIEDVHVVNKADALVIRLS